MGRFFGVMAFAAVARLLGPAPVLAEEPSAIGIIKVRQEVDGAGPSNVFRLQRNIVVLADPLKADIKAYDMETKAAALGSCGMPRDFKPWRLVRSRDAVSIVDEAERSTIEIPRARAFGPRCRLNVRPYNAARDGYHRLRRVDNRTIAVPSRRWERGRPLTVRAAAFELLSVRELERDAAGNRYVLAKVLQPKDKAHAGEIGVKVTVLRYDPRGRLNGAYRVPFENRKKRAFDYVAVLPAGDLVLALYDEASDQFRLDRIPMPYVTGAKKSIIPANVPNATAQDGFEMATEALAAGHLSGAPTFADAEPSRTPAGAKLQARSGPQIVAEARKYLDQTWDYHTPAAQMTPAPKDEGVYLWRLGNAEHKWVQPAHHRGIAAGTKLRGLALQFRRRRHARDVRQQGEGGCAGRAARRPDPASRQLLRARRALHRNGGARLLSAARPLLGDRPLRRRRSQLLDGGAPEARGDLPGAGPVVRIPEGRRRHQSRRQPRRDLPAHRGARRRLEDGARDREREPLQRRMRSAL